MPLYMDIHKVESDDFTVEDVVKAHMQDLAIEERFGVTQIKYWVNEQDKTIFCLMKGPNKEACNDVHKESHGNTACNIIEVSDDEYKLFLGEGKSVNDLAHTNSGEVDTGYRSVLLLNITNFSDTNGSNLNEIYSLIEKHNGVRVIQPEDDILVSFIYASDAILCALAINTLLKSSPLKVEFSMALVSGKPVDEEGNNLFEETKKKLQYLILVGMRQTIYLDFETKTLADKERFSSKTELDDFIIIQNNDFEYLFQLVDVLNNQIPNMEFKSEDLNTLLGTSKSKTYRNIKSLTGQAPNQLIQEIRLHKSLKSLKLNKKTVSEIAFESGFNSPTYFARIFKKRFDITPTRFSNIYKNR